MSKRKILIVEDDKDVLLGLSIRLKASGYSVVSATDAAWATTVARKEKPDLAIVDLGLPGGNGFLVIERLRSITRKPLPPGSPRSTMAKSGFSFRATVVAQAASVAETTE